MNVADCGGSMDAMRTHFETSTPCCGTPENICSTSSSFVPDATYMEDDQGVMVERRCRDVNDFCMMNVADCGGTLDAIRDWFDANTPCCGGGATGATENIFSTSTNF